MDSYARRTPACSARAPCTHHVLGLVASLFRQNAFTDSKSSKSANQHVSEMGGCSAFHGCPTLTDRNTTLLSARRCLWAHLFGGVPSSCSGEVVSRGETSCGFSSTAARTWLRRLHDQTRHCRTVRYTVITGGYDSLTRITNAPHPSVSTCNVAFVDDATRSASGAHGWQLFTLPEPPPFDSPARLAHSMKASALRLFPRASATLFTDGKILLRQPLEEFMAEAAALSDKPIMVGIPSALPLGLARQSGMRAHT